MESRPPQTGRRTWEAGRHSEIREIIGVSSFFNEKRTDTTISWAEIFWIPSRTHQLESDGATGKGPGGGGLPWRSERSSWVVLSVPGGGRVHGIGCGQAGTAVGAENSSGQGLKTLGCFGIMRAGWGLCAGNRHELPEVGLERFNHIRRGSVFGLRVPIA